MLESELALRTLDILGEKMAAMAWAKMSEFGGVVGGVGQSGYTEAWFWCWIGVGDCQDVDAGLGVLDSNIRCAEAP